MRWYEYRMEVDSLQASDQLKARLRALQPEQKQEEPPAERPEPSRRRPAVHFSVRRAAALAACFALGAVAWGTVGSSLTGMGAASMASRSTEQMASVYATAQPEAAAAGAADALSATNDGTVLLTGSNLTESMEQRQAAGAKIIYTARLELESKNYDETRAALQEAVDAAGGYMESCDEYSYDGSARSLEMTLRVPQDQYADFLTEAGRTGNLTSRSEQAEDITAQYMDVAARLENLESRRQRLLELQAQAENLGDLLEIESALSDVQYQLESWQRQMDWYDDQVDYCTVVIALQEVKVYTPAAEQSFGQRVGGALSRGWQNFVEGGQEMLVWLAGVWPAAILVCAAGGCALAFKVRGAKNKKSR